jgi:hypothetical protein
MKRKKDADAAEKLDQFFTPDPLAAAFVEWMLTTGTAFLLPTYLSRRTLRVLEPSAGDGALVDAIAERCEQAKQHTEITVVEIDPNLLDQAISRCLRKPRTWVSYRWLHADFLSIPKADLLPMKGQRQVLYDLALMNPPFDAMGDHVERALTVSYEVSTIAPLALLSGNTRYSQIWSGAELIALAIMSKRPAFRGPADSGHSGKRDMMFAKLRKRTPEETSQASQPNVTRKRINAGAAKK